MSTMQEVVYEFERIARDGVITPTLVLEHASDPSSILHGFFEWDDTEAARRFRLVQAGNLIARVRVVWKEREAAKRVSMRMYYDVSEARDSQRQYASILTMDEGMLERARANARRDMVRMRERYRDIDLLPIAQEVFRRTTDSDQAA